MGFKIFGKKNGKRIVSDKPENGDTKVTEATNILPEGDPEAVKKGSIIRFIWIPETGNAYCWIQGEVENTSISEEKSKKGTKVSNKVTLKKLVLVECYGDEYDDKLPENIKIELNSPRQTWVMGPETNLGTGGENEAVQIDIDSIPRVIPWDSDDVIDKIEMKGAAGGIPVSQHKNNSIEQYSFDEFWNSEDESSDSYETSKRLDCDNIKADTMLEDEGTDEPAMNIHDEDSVEEEMKGLESKNDIQQKDVLYKISKRMDYDNAKGNKIVETSLEEDDAKMINNSIDIHYSQLSVKKSIENMTVSPPNSNIHNDGKAEVINDVKDIVPDIDSAFAFKVCSEEDNLGRWLYTAGVISTNLRSNILSDTEKSTGEKDEVELIKVTTKDDIEKVRLEVKKNTFVSVLE